MAEEPECQLRRRRSSGNPNLPLHLEGYQVNEGSADQGTPSPSCVRFQNSKEPGACSAAMMEFRKRQQSFEIQIEECEEEEIVVDSEGEEGDELGPSSAHRPITPTPIQDFGAKVVYTEGPQVSDFLRVKSIEQECVTDVSDAEVEEEE